jgi:hypothetical protein
MRGDGGGMSYRELATARVHANYRLLKVLEKMLPRFFRGVTDTGRNCPLSVSRRVTRGGRRDDECEGSFPSEEGKWIVPVNGTRQ